MKKIEFDLITNSTYAKINLYNKKATDTTQ